MSNQQQTSVENLPVVRGWISQFLDIKKFYATRKAIYSGEALWNYKIAELEAKKYQSAWTFNLQESTLAALPSLLILRFLNFLYPSEKVLTSNPQTLSHFVQYVQQINPGVTQTIFSFFAPLVLMLTAYMAGWASLHKVDRTKSNIQRNLAAYLFFDGAFGLWAQMSLSFGLGLGLWLNQHDKGNIYTIIIVLLTGLSGLFYSNYLLGNRIPKLLFLLQGYSTERPDFLSWYLSQRIENPGPWRTWRFSQGIGGVALILLLWLILFVASLVVSYTLAALKYWLVG